ncbi:ankyrin repeat domain-containing protein [Cardinium endosymbiont of Oedothorax gibbosus]|uniref:ankyrin repeat domain-containing protein n=1 Tax=Cardinium endosymbiont of Oedothorax gibbosus TaxID=931101 RepID=UPI002024BD5B|nr:ankyrin repeat domain-containing protein [Cardinium endosymbiont of Oedothorax gibbosus]
MEEFLGKGIDIELLNRLNRNGSALLHLALQHGHVGVVNALITKGIDVNLQDSNGATA